MYTYFIITVECVLQYCFKINIKRIVICYTDRIGILHDRGIILINKYKKEDCSRKNLDRFCFRPNVLK